MKISELELRPAQRFAIDRLNDSDENLVVQLPTGGGKTILAMAYMNEHKDKRFLIVTHNLTLMHQFADELELFGIDSQVYHGSGRDELQDCHVLVSTYQTLARSLDDFSKPIDCLIIDEAHKQLNESAYKITNKFSGARRIGLTATPIQPFGAVVEFKAMYDNILITSSAKEQFDSGVLVRPTLKIISAMDDKTKSKLLNDKSSNDFQQKTLESITVGQDPFDVVKHWKKHVGSGRTIVFCSSIKHAKRVDKDFREEGYKSTLLVGDPGEEEDYLKRDEVIKQFSAGDIEIICSVNIVVEGFNEPLTHCAVLARPTKNLGVAIQSMGRVLRSHPDKTEAIILDLANVCLCTASPEEELPWEQYFREGYKPAGMVPDESPVEYLMRMMGDNISCSSGSSKKDEDLSTLVPIADCPKHGEYEVKIGPNGAIGCEACLIVQGLKNTEDKRKRLATSYKEFRDLWNKYVECRDNFIKTLEPRHFEMFFTRHEVSTIANRPYTGMDMDRLKSLCIYAKVPVNYNYLPGLKWSEMWPVLHTVNDIVDYQKKINKSAVNVLKIMRDFRYIQSKLNVVAFTKCDEVMSHSLKPEFQADLLMTKSFINILEQMESNMINQTGETYD